MLFPARRQLRANCPAFPGPGLGVPGTQKTVLTIMHYRIRSKHRQTPHYGCHGFSQFRERPVWASRTFQFILWPRDESPVCARHRIAEVAPGDKSAVRAELTDGKEATIMTRKIALLPGDGIGPEIVESTRSVLDLVSQRFDLGLHFQTIAVGFEALEQTGSTFPEAVMDELAPCAGIVLGPVSHNSYPPRKEGGLNPSGELRIRLDLYANIRPARTRADIPPRAGKPLDLVIVRENTEGFYADRNLYQGPGEFLVTEDIAMALRRITRHASTRIAREAFRIAAVRNRRVTAVHKANVMRVSCGLFLDCCRKVAAEYPDIDYDEQLVDAACAHLVRDPEQYDVIVTTNMFGDILSDLASELSGSLGLAASLNAGENAAMAQAQHGSAPDIAGQNIANPTSLIASAGMLLTWLGEREQEDGFVEAATAIDAALEATLREPAARTRDLGGMASTMDFTRAILEKLGSD
jgi:isocitrate/isopropylmalate dehydrogenase